MTRVLTEVPLLAIHSQSNRPDAPLDFSALAEQAFDSRALALPDTALIATNMPIEMAYLHYLTDMLHLPVPEIITPLRRGVSLSESIQQSPDVLREIKDTQRLTKMPFVLSVFDPTDSERELFTTLQEYGIHIISEVNYDVATRLGNKAGFREFCTTYGIPQLPGESFTDKVSLETFIREMQTQGKGVVIKHPNGTAGEGLSLLKSEDVLTEADLQKWEGWAKHAGAVVAEVLHEKGGEHALHVYIDPVTKKPKITGIYDQLTSTTAEGAQAHYGARSPLQDQNVRQQLTDLAHTIIIPALLAERFTGPACFDVLSDPLHFMELNARDGANFYADRMTERVAKAVYGRIHPEGRPFMFLASLDVPEGIRSFTEFYERYKDVLEPKANGTLILTNPGRHMFGKYDVIAYSPYGVDEAEKVLREGITAIWGEEKATDYFAKIHKRK